MTLYLSLYFCRIWCLEGPRQASWSLQKHNLALSIHFYWDADWFFGKKTTWRYPGTSAPFVEKHISAYCRGEVPLELAQKSCWRNSKYAKNLCEARYSEGTGLQGTIWIYAAYHSLAHTSQMQCVGVYNHQIFPLVLIAEIVARADTLLGPICCNCACQIPY